jgi:hypothetical protein
VPEIQRRSRDAALFRADELRSLACQGLLNPSFGFFGSREQGRITIVAFAEPSFQMPPPRVLRVMVLAVEADDHGGKLAIREDKVALTVMAINELAHRLERDVEGITFAFMLGRRVGCQMARHLGNKASLYA